MSMTETAKPLKSNAYAVTSSRGLDEWGLYFEFVELDAGLSQIRHYCRVFVAHNHVSFYERKAETARTTWKSFTKKTPEEARAWATKLLTRGKGNNVMRGSPLLVQLEPADVETMNQGKSPGARYRGTSRHESLFGKLEVHQDARPSTFDYSGVQKAVEAITLVSAAPTAAAAAAAAAPVMTTTISGAGGATVTLRSPHPPTVPSGLPAATVLPEHPTRNTELSSPINWEPY